MPRAVTYGLIVFAAIWFVGWSTGMGGSFLPNLIFSVLMGLLALFLVTLVLAESRPTFVDASSPASQ